MSSDNGVYILSTISKWKKENGSYRKRDTPIRVYRVAHISAIDNFDWYKEHQPYNLGCYLKECWGRSEVYESEEKAIEAALEMAKSIEILEYGVSFIHTDYSFFSTTTLE